MTAPPIPSRKFQLIVHAPNVHTGGGRVLLSSILEALLPIDGAALNIDRRLKLDFKLNEKWVVNRIAPTLGERYGAERALIAQSKSASAALCFGNLPPAFKPACVTTVFFQNRNLLDGADLSGFSWKAQQRHRLERLWIRVRQSNASRFVVQGPSMASSFKKTFATNRRVEVWPVLPPDLLAKIEARKPASFADMTKREFDFVYVSSGEPHKNHRTLIAAWQSLAVLGKFPKLALTLEPVVFAAFEPLIKSKKLKIVNFAGLDRKGVAALYERSRCLIYPSLSESFGLPLLEAAAASIAILASDLPYVDEVVQASGRFDPRSAESIVAAVEQFNAGHLTATPLIRPGLIGPATFLEKLIGKQELRNVDTKPGRSHGP